MQGRRILFWLMSTLLLEITSSVFAESNIDELNKEIQNAVANLVSVPFQNNFNFNVGKNKQLQYCYNSKQSTGQRWRRSTLLPGKTYRIGNLGGGEA